MRQAAAPAGEHTASALRSAWLASSGVRALFSTDDPDHAQATVGRVFRPHRLAATGGARRLQAAMDYLPVGSLSLSRLRYGCTVDILPGPLERFYLIQIPVSGQAQVETSQGRVDSSPACASLLSPQPDLSMRWNDDNDQIILRLDADLVQRYCASWCGDPRVAAPVFEPDLVLDRMPALGELLLALVDLAERGPPATEGLSLVQLQYRLLATLLSAQPHSLQDRLAAQCPPLAPRYVRRVEDYLVAHAQEAITPEALAELAGVSVRSLFLGFQRYRRISPMKFLREVRLHHVRDELLLAAAGTTVTDVALRWGFFHLGRFAQEYRDAFGETPRQTLAHGMR